MKDSMKLTVPERNTLLELAHLLNEGLGDIAVMLAEPWLQDAPRMTTPSRNCLPVLRLSPGAAIALSKKWCCASVISSSTWCHER